MKKKIQNQKKLKSQTMTPLSNTLFQLRQNIQELKVLLKTTKLLEKMRKK